MRDLNITHLVISGGGMRGAVYIGALRYLYLENFLGYFTNEYQRILPQK